MSGSVEREWREALQLGEANRETLELARRHCLNMEFVPSGGRGLVEVQTGLPIDMRQVRCTVALGNMAMNLHWIATDFYRAHCVGCGLRRPTGAVPNLASVVEDEDSKAAAAAARERDRLAQARTQRLARDEQRRVLAARSSEAMTGALADIGVIDGHPDADVAEREAARARLSALADRAPQLFTSDVVMTAISLVETTSGVSDLLDPLRRLALRREEFQPDVARVAVVALRRERSEWAGRCIADLAPHVPAAFLDEQACLALVHLAGAPTLDPFGRSQPGHTNDPTGLIAAADIAPEALDRVLKELLPPPAAQSALVVPSPISAPPIVSAFDRASAAGAVRALVETHPDLTDGLVDAMVMDLAVPPDDEYHDPAHPALEHSLATLLVLRNDHVIDVLEAAGRRGSTELRERLVQVLSRAADMMAPDPRWREPGDPTPGQERVTYLTTAFLEFAVARVGGDWGDEVRVNAAEVVKDLAKHSSDTVLSSLPTLLGTVLTLVDAEQEEPSNKLDIVPGQDPTLRALEHFGRTSVINGATRRILDAVEALAAVDSVAVCTAIADLITDERDTERSTGLVWWLIRTIGRIGRRHGEDAECLRTILPVLHSYLVDADVSLQSRAIDAWVEIAAAHDLPSSLSDLLPALVDDKHIVVAQALARAASRLDWTEAARRQLLFHAIQLLTGVDPTSHAEAVNDAIGAILAVSSEAERSQRKAIEEVALRGAARLDGYDLQRALHHSWLPETAQSTQMARLRLLQAADPRINDRWNAGDDQELCALLACGPGLTDLPTQELSEAAVALSPDNPLGAAEFAEVAWRAARPEDAVAIMTAVHEATPGQPAYASHRSLIELIRTAAEADAAAVAGGDWESAAERLTAAVGNLTSDKNTDVVRQLTTSASAAVDIRRSSSSSRPGDPVQALRQRADAVTDAGAALATASRYATETCAYLRAFASSCDAVAHLMRAEAASLDADITKITAHARAAARRTDLVVAELTERFGDADPLAGPLLGCLTAIANLEPGAPTAPVLAQWHSLSIPLPVVRGPRRRNLSKDLGVQPSTRSGETGIQDVATPVAVALASIDGQLVTGPEVLRPGRVYEVKIEVQTDPWPEWANRLEGEFLTHLTTTEITTPEFTWGREDYTGDGESYVKAGPLVLRFDLGPGQPAPPFLLRLTWRGERDGQSVSQRLDIAGHREVRLRPYDASRDRATDYPVFDGRLLDMYERLARAGYDADQLQAFCRLLTSICRIGLRMTWDKKYRRGTRVSERQFHDDLHHRLLADPELDGRVERGSPLALGFLDVRHDGITAELKVERRTPVTRDTAPKYMGQPTQYAAADGARLSILTILDMSPKLLPIGTPENYLFWLEPRLHGLENPEAPSLVAVLIVNGNMPTPSSWSRRKTPTTEDA